MTKTTYTIQEVSQLTGLTAHTLRYYEKISLIRGIERDANGYRLYSESDVAWLEFLIRLRETGMPIQEMIRFSSLRSEGETTVRQRRELLELHERSIRSQLADLYCHLGKIEEKIIHYKQLEEEHG
ncbi:MerR family transcriptional regulator [Cohnella lubricantis]|uniref:MerR family transcriptional regulator n=1 Tax=Cohnella lubricantis TaxID=2163172 RepID=A0A841T7J0_9BACL|nr:MerR family transcriptional regulator [Cohnella lubricantis]MBB6675925.1 MerR family transcriptional regulator [Cohnella lubricantis]MBP2117158.1 DNA-binding transcriptional MerR regulator [Cohnella lubricantis]